MPIVNKIDLSDLGVRRILSTPERLIEAVVSVLRGDSREQAVSLIMRLGEVFISEGQPKLALTICEAYLRRWQHENDQPTTEVMQLAGNAAGEMGELSKAENFLTEVIRRSSENRWQVLHRQGLQSLGVIRNQQGRFVERDQLYESALKIALAARDRLGEAQLYNNLAASLLDRGDAKKAESLLRKSRSLKRRLGDELGSAKTGVTLSGVLAEKRRFSEAIRVLQQTVRISRRFNDRGTLAMAYFNLGHVLLDQGKIQRGIHLMNRAVQIAEGSDDAQAKKTCSQGLAVTYFKNAKYELSAKYFRRLVELNDFIGNASDAAIAQHDLGAALVLNGNKDLAKVEIVNAFRRFTELRDLTWSAKTILTLAESAAEPDEVARLLQEVVIHAQSLPSGFPIAQLSELCFRLGLTELALRFVALERSHLKDQIGHTWAQRLMVLGAAALHFRHWKIASELFREALRKSRSLAHEDVAKLENDLGIAQLESGENSKALRHFQRAIQIAITLRNRVQLAQSSHNAGEAYRRSGEHKRATDYLERALALGSELHDFQLQADTLEVLGLTYMDLGRYDRAMDTFSSLSLLGDRSGNPLFRGEGEAGMGHVEYAQRSLRNCRQRYERAAQIFKQAGTNREVANVLYDLGGVYRDLGQQQKAADTWSESIRLAVSLPDWSLASKNYQAQARLIAEGGSPKQAAELSALALLSGIADMAEHDQSFSYESALRSYIDVLTTLLTKRKADARLFARATIGELRKRWQLPEGHPVEKTIEELTNLFRSHRGVRYVRQLQDDANKAGP